MTRYGDNLNDAGKGKKRSPERRESATERMSRGYAARPPGPNVARAMAAKKAERERAAEQLREARAKRLERRNKTSEGRT